MNKTRLWMVCALLTIALLSSCSIQEIFSDTVEFEANKGLQKAKPSKGKPSAKQEAKETERLKQEGKCSTCKGVGKTPDGRYICSACNGTGLIENSNKNQK